MSPSKHFFDTNILLYLLSEDDAKADKAEEIISLQGLISVQVLNEFTSVARRKAGMEYDKIAGILEAIQQILNVEPLDIKTWETGIDIARRYGFSFYDSLIVASALNHGCEVLYSEDLQHGQLINGTLRILNPFL